jgi:RND family efflux transporter MFP subunit
MNRVLTIALGVAVLAAAAGTYWYTTAASGVTVAEARTGRAVEAVYATAVVEPVHWGRVGPIATGRIAEIKVREGERVVRGQELARIDDDSARARIRELDARIGMLRADVARLRPLAKQGYSSQQSLERTESELEQVRASLAAARHALDQLVLRAPVDGIVLRRDGELGETVGSDRTLFWIGTPYPLRAEAEVDEEDIPRVRVGHKVLIKADAFPGQVLEGTVAEITPKGDPVSKSYRVRIALPDDTPLMIGMTIETNTVVRVTGDAVLVPVTAVAAEGDVVWRVEDGRARRTPVVLGVRAPEEVEVRSGLAAGARVILSPPDDLKDGAPVRVRGTLAP